MHLNPYLYGLARAANNSLDPYARNVVLWVDGQGTAGATTPQDQSCYANVPSLVSTGASVITSDKRYGTSCFRFANGGYLSYGNSIGTGPTDPDGVPVSWTNGSMSIGTANFTYEVSLLLDASMLNKGVFTLLGLASSEASGRITFYINASNKLTCNLYGGSDAFPGNYDMSALLGTWFDFALVRNGGTLTFYINGVSIGSLTGYGGSLGNGVGGMMLGGTVGYPWQFANLRFTRNAVRTIAPLTQVLPLPTQDPVTMNLQFEGAGGSTAFYDEALGSSVAVNVNSTLDATAPYWGRTTGRFQPAGSANTGLNITPMNSPGAGSVLDNAQFALGGIVHWGSLPTASPGGQSVLVSTYSGATGWNLYMNANRELMFSGWLSDGTGFNTATLRAVPIHRWSYVEVTRTGPHIWLTVDGVPVGYGKIIGGKGFTPSTAPALWVGSQGNSLNFDGWLDGWRFKNGGADFPGLAWSSMYVPATGYPMGRANDRYWDDVAILVANDPSDRGPQARTPVSNSLTVSATQKDFNGNPMMVVGGGAYMRVATGSDVVFGTGDFTVEFDYYSTDTVNGNCGLISGKAAAADANFLIDIYLNTTGGQTVTTLQFWTTGTGSQQTQAYLPQNKLCHVVFMRRGNILMSVVNDAITDWKYFATPENISLAGDVYIGKVPFVGGLPSGFISNLRITKGRMRRVPKYTHNVPTKPLGNRFARWDNYDHGANGTLSNSDRTYTGKDAVRSNVGVSSGKWYWEVTSAGSRFPIIGVGQTNASVEGSPAYPGQNSQSWGYWGANSTKITNGAQTAYGFSWTSASDVIGVYLDMDAGTLGFTKNGSDMGIAFRGLTGTVYAMVGGDDGTANSNATANFGNAAFSYSAPAGYNAGFYEANVDDVPTYTALADDTPYNVGFQITGQADYHQGPIIYDTGRYAFRQTNTTVNSYCQAKIVKSGDTALYVSPAGNLLSYPVGTTLDFSQPRWSLRGWFYWTADTIVALMARRPNAAPTTGWGWHNTALKGKVAGTYSDTALSWVRPSANTWHHMELVRDGVNLYAFIDGVLVASRNDVSSFDNPSSDLVIGSTVSDASELRGDLYVNDVEFWSGVPLHSTLPAFTPPVAPYDSSSPQYANTSLLIHFDGANGSTALTDSSPRPKAITSAVALSTAQSKFGGSSALFDGSTQYASVASSTEFDFTGDFTIDAWVFPTNLSGIRMICMRQQPATGVAFEFRLDNGVLIGVTRGVSQSGATGVNSTITIAANVWSHLAFQRRGQVLMAYVNGVLAGAATEPALANLTDTQPLYIGCYQDTGGGPSSYYFAGYIEELRLVKDVALYGGSFTPTVRAASTWPAISSYPNVKFWMDATDTNTLVLNGSKVSGWKEKISGQMFAQGTAANQPSLNAALAGGQMVDFGADSVSRWLENATGIQIKGICTIYIVGYWANNPTTSNMLGILGVTGQSGISAQPWLIAYRTSTAPDALEFGQDATNQIVKTGVFTRGAPFLLEVQAERTVSAVQARLSGSPLASPNLLGSRLPESYTFHSLGAPDPAFVPNGAYGEIIMIEGFASPQVSRAIRNYLAAKWKLG